MEAEGRIADGENVRLVPWQPEEALRVLSQEEARFSRGFLSASPLSWFSGVDEQWKPFFHTLAADVVVCGFNNSFVFPENVSNVAVVEIDGEEALIGFSSGSEKALVQAVVPGTQGVGADIVIEYLVRRLLSTLSKGWKGEEPLRCYYLSSSSVENVAVSGVTKAVIEIGGLPCEMWFGLGPRFLERLDGMWREDLLRSIVEQGENVFSDHIHTVGVELAELAVPPAMLIDYMRSGTIIDLEVPVSPKVQLKVDGVLWAEGELSQYNGTTSVVITDIDPVVRDFPESTTRVRVEIARAELDQESLIEHRQRGAVLLTNTPVGPNVSLIISDENVASAVLGQIDGRFALSVLPK